MGEHLMLKDNDNAAIKVSVYPIKDTQKDEDCSLVYMQKEMDSILNDASAVHLQVKYRFNIKKNWQI